MDHLVKPSSLCTTTAYPTRVAAPYLSCGCQEPPQPSSVGAFCVARPAPRGLEITLRPNGHGSGRTHISQVILANIRGRANRAATRKRLASDIAEPKSGDRMNGFRYPIGPPFGAFPPIIPPFGARFAAGARTTEPTLRFAGGSSALAAEGLLPPEFWAGPSVAEMGRENAKILKSDFDMGVTRPETPQEVVSARGQVGDTFRTAQPMNLGRGVPLSQRATRACSSWRREGSIV